MTQKGPVQGDAAHGFDKPYARDRGRADKELDSTLAGSRPRAPVPRDDTGLKNPDGDMDHPAAKP